MRCLWHQEATASLVQRKDGWFCYGVCNKLYSPEQVEERTGQHYEYEEQEEDYQEDLEERFRDILSLRRIEHRGLEFPADAGGYYICWPDGSYYKYRLFNPGKGGKYLSPKGHKPKMFWVRKKGAATLCLSEGEVNALSIAKTMPEWDVCSPGSATNFNSNNLSKYLTQLKEYSNVVVVLDKDAAGTKALIETKACFLYKIPFVSYIQMSVDANEVLIEKGPKALREILQGSNCR